MENSPDVYPFDFCFIACFQVVFSFSWRILFEFFYYLCLFDGIRFQYLSMLSERSDFILDSGDLLLPSSSVFIFSLLPGMFDTWLTKAWTAIDRLLIIWKSDMTDKMKRNFFQAAVISILLYGCTTWTLTKRPKKELDGNYIRILRAIVNKSWR